MIPSAKCNCVIVSHPTGNRNSRATVNAFYKANYLQRFYTSIASPVNWGPFKKRAFPLPMSKIRQNPTREVVRQFTKRFHQWPIHTHETGFCSIDQIYQSIDRRVANDLERFNPTSVYAYEDGALESFKKAKSLGMTCIYELPIAYGSTSRALLEEEANRYPNWEPTLIGTQDSESKLARKEEELELADIIICPSQFVKNSIPKNYQENKIIGIIPYGTDPVELQAEEKNRKTEKLQLLFVGLLSQRKGLADLFEAIKKIPSHLIAEIELHIVGQTILPLDFYKSQGVNFVYHGTQPRDEILRLMKRSDFLLLPSIVEGRALVQLEALSQGLPLLISTNTGGDDLIIEGKTGFQLPIRDPESWAKRILWCIENRSMIPSMKQASYEKAKQVTWEDFEGKLIGFLKQSGVI